MFKKIYQPSLHLVFSFALIVIGIIKANAATLNYQNPAQPQLSVTPNICLTDEEFNYCEINIVLEWVRIAEGNVCILSDNPDLPQWCSDDINQDTVNFTVKTEKDIQFILVRQESNQPLAGVKLKVNKAAKQSVRKRYRNHWSLF